MQFDSIEIPVGYLASVVDAARDTGVDISSYLATQRFSKALIRKPESKIKGHVFKDAILHGQELYSLEKPFSLEVAKHFPLTSHGTLSLAIMCAPNFRVASKLAEDYSSLIMPSFFIELIEQPNISYLRLSPQFELGADIEPIMEVIVGIFHSAKLIVGTPPLQVYLAHNPKAAIEHYENFWQCKVAVNQKYYQIALETALLDKPLPTSNSENFNRLKQELDEQYNAELSNSKFKLKIQKLLSLTTEGNFLSLEQIADELSMSPRTFRRKLTNEKTTYKKLVNQAKRVISERNLKNKDKPINQIYRSAGFSNEASFSRAFKSWTGKTPLQYRNESTD